MRAAILDQARISPGRGQSGVTVCGQSMAGLAGIGLEKSSGAEVFLMTGLIVLLR